MINYTFSEYTSVQSLS